MVKLVMVSLKAEIITYARNTLVIIPSFFLKITTPGEKTQSHCGFIWCCKKWYWLFQV